MNKKIILFTLVLAGLFLVMAAISVAINRQSRRSIAVVPQAAVSLPAKEENKPEAQKVEKQTVAGKQEPRLPSGPLPN